MTRHTRIAASLPAALLLSLALAVAPACLRAQYRDGGGGSSTGAGPDSARSTWQQVDVIALVLSHRSDLALADSQVTRLTAIEAAHDSANAPLRARLDSLRGEGGPRGGGDLSDADRAAMHQRFQAMRDAFAGIRDHDQAARKEAYALLTSDQRKKAERLEDDARKSMGGAERGRGGRGGRRGMGGRGGWGGRRPGGDGGMGFPPPV